MNINNFIQELKRRNVFRVATAYAIAGWLIIQIVSVVFPAFNFPEWTTQFVIILVVIGFVISLFIAWAFELTPDGLKKTESVEKEESIANQTGKKLNQIIIGVLSVAVVFLLVDKFFLEAAPVQEIGQTSIDKASIAVLPFTNMSSDTENEYFSDGLSEELLNGLAKLEGLQVAGRNSSFQFKGTNPDLRVVGEQLGVNHVLEGSVRKTGTRVRITAQLIQSNNGFQLWSETYDRELTANDIFDIQEEITREVVAELQVQLLPEEEEAIADNNPTQDIDAYDAYLEATQIELTNTVTDLEAAEEKYKEAIEIDPNFAEAYARLALVYSNLHLNGNLPLEEAKNLMRANIDKAMALDDNSARAYQALAAYYNWNAEFDREAEAIERALELLPNDAGIRLNYSDILWAQDKASLAVEELFRAYQLDPFNPQIADRYAGYLYNIDQFEESMAVFDRIISARPDYVGAYFGKIYQLIDAPYGRLDEAFELAYNLYKDQPEVSQVYAYLNQISASLQFDGFTNFIVDELTQKFPESARTIIEQERMYFAHQEFEKLDSLSSLVIENYGNDAIEWMGNSRVVVSYEQGKYEEGIRVLEEFVPELFETPKNINDGNVDQAVMLAKLLEADGQEEAHEEMVEEFCAFAYGTANTRPDEQIQINDSWPIMQCRSLSGDVSGAVAMLERLYFTDNSKANWDYYFNLDLQYRALEDEPEFIEIKDRIEEDLAGMRENVIEFLKEEGDWREEWAQTN